MFGLQGLMTLRIIVRAVFLIVPVGLAKYCFLQISEVKGHNIDESQKLLFIPPG